MCNSRWLHIVYEGLTWWLESLKLSFLVEKKLRIEIVIATLKKSGILLLDAAASTPDAESVYIPQDAPVKMMSNRITMVFARCLTSKKLGRKLTTEAAFSFSNVRTFDQN